MRMPKKMGHLAYQEMMEARPDRNTTSRWLPVLEEWSGTRRRRHGSGRGRMRFCEIPLSGEGGRG